MSNLTGGNGGDNTSPAPLFENTEREWLDTAEAASYLGVSMGSLRNMTSARQVPSYTLGRRVRYLRRELRELLLSNRRGES